MADAQIKSYFDRIERLEEEKRAIGADVRSVYDEAKDAGHDPRAMRKIVAERRMKDREAIMEAMDGYRLALGMAAAAVRDGMPLDAAAEEYGFSRSAIHRESQRDENQSSGTTCEMTADDIGTFEPAREMVADDLGDPLLVIDRSRAVFREKIRRAASTIRPQVLTSVAPLSAQDLDLTPPSFLDQRKQVTVT